MTRRRQSQIASSLLIGLLLAASCSAETGEIGAGAAAVAEENYVTFDDETTTADAPPDPIEQQVSAETTEELMSALETVVDRRDQIVVGDASESVLVELVTPDVLDAVVAERDVNVSRIEAYDRDARVRYETTTHVLSVAESGRGLIAEVCNERRGDRQITGYEIEFVHELFSFDPTVDPWVLTAVETLHDGKWETGGVTCIPPEMAQRAIAVAADALTALDSLLASPDLVASTNLEDHFGGVALNSFQVGLANPPFSDRRRVTPTEYRYEVLGIDPANSPYIAVLEVCRLFPEGAYDEINGTGERVLADPLWVEGSSSLDRISVNLGPKYDYDTGPTDVVWDFEFSFEISCWP